MTPTDADLQKNVIEALKWEPSVTHEHIGVYVANGVVTLTGVVPSYIEKHNAERVVEKMADVKAIVEKIEVHLKGDMIRDDSAIAKAILDRFHWSVLVPEDKVHVQVSDGWVTLKGELDWEFQRKAAEKLVRELTGVVHVSNAITLKPTVQAINPVKVKDKIEKALHRATQRESDRITIDVKGTCVTLRGNVRSLAEKNIVEATTWGCPGITEVQDRITVKSL